MGNMCDSFIIYEDNQNEFKIWQGLVGAHYTPHVDDVGNLSWTNNGELPNPPTVNINGRGLTITGVVATTGDLPETAAQYDTYLVGSDEEYYAYMYVNGTWTNMGLMGRGEQGIPGFSPVVTVSPITGGHQISITDAEDTETFNVMDGVDGQDGAPGVGVPTGGTTGQVLAKASGTNYDTEWVNQSAAVEPATVAPLMDGTAAVGTATKYAREDHVHPTDTSRASQTDMTNAQGNITSLQSGKADASSFKAFTVALSSSGWSSNTQTVSDAKFIASGYSYIVSPASASFADYGAAQIYADDVSTDGSMTFHCDTAPSSNLTVNVVRVVAS